MEAAILWLLIWAVLAFALPALIVWGFGLTGITLGGRNFEVGGIVGFVIGWIVAIVWFIFAAWRAILEIITIVGFLT